jgi:hypothetical protein
MGRIGKSYPRFEETPKPPVQPAEEERISTVHVVGAVVGILSALGFIGWLLTR